MYSVRPGTELIPYFMPAGTPQGGIRDPEGTEYPCLFEGQDPKAFNFFEASSIRKVGNKYVTIYSGYSGLITDWETPIPLYVMPTVIRR